MIEVVVAASNGERMSAMRAAAARMIGTAGDSVTLMDRSDIDALRRLVEAGRAGKIRFVYGDLGVIRSAHDLAALPESADAVLVVAGERLAAELRLAAAKPEGRA